MNCSRDVQDEIHLDFRITETCTNSSFTDPRKITGQNSILQAESAAWTFENNGFNFTLSVNSVFYKGSLSAENVYSMICHSFKDPPHVCMSVIKAPTPAEEEEEEVHVYDTAILWIIFVVLLVLTILLIIALLLIWRKQKLPQHRVVQVVDDTNASEVNDIAPLDDNVDIRQMVIDEVNRLDKKLDNE